MTQSEAFPDIMANAREDLAGNISGEFSPEDWVLILAEAKRRLETSGKSHGEAWVEVIRDFHRESYWGFTPSYRKPRRRREDENLGNRFLWYSFRSFLITKVVVLYFGARYSADQGGINGWLFFGAIVFMLSNYGLFLWRYGHRHKDDRR